MPWSLTDPPADVDVVRLVLEGELEGTDLEQAFAAVLVRCEQTDCYRVLADLRGMTGGHSVFDLYGLIRDLEDLGVIGRFREALVVGEEPEVVALATFFRTAGLNRGLPVEVFTDEAQALAWATAPSGAAEEAAQ